MTRERMDSETVESLTNILLRHGFRRCDIAACNCGSWHHTGGLAERWREIEDDLAEAGHPLTNKNGHLLRKALAALVGERDGLATQLATAQAELARVAAERDGARAMMFRYAMSLSGRFWRCLKCKHITHSHTCVHPCKCGNRPSAGYFTSATFDEWNGQNPGRQDEWIAFAHQAAPASHPTPEGKP